MVMQVGLKTTTTSSTASSVRTLPGAAAQIARAERVASPSHATPAFPEAALLSRRPLRYNVQLNQQLTAVQQADNYLSETETQLLLLRHQSGRDGISASSSLNTLLHQRGPLSGGTVDRNFSLTLEQKSQVKFTLSGVENWLEQPQGETLVFQLGGGQRELTAVALPAQASPRQALAHLNVGLGRLGINASLTPEGTVAFQVEEARWSRVSQHLSVRGEGQRFPADAFTLLAPQAEISREDEINQLAARRERVDNKKLQQTLDQITRERSKLHFHQDRVSTRIQDMSTAYSPGEARETARALGEALAGSGTQYGLLSKALAAQGNLHMATVKNLLG